MSIIIMAISLIISIHSSNQLRKIKATEAVTYYIESTTDIASLSVAIVSSFSQEQCEILYRQEELTVNAERLSYFCYICPNKEFCRKSDSQKLCKTNNNEVVLHQDVSFLIRDNVLRYLSTLECVLLYWELGVVDQKIIEKELLFLAQKDGIYNGLEKMRLLFGGAEAYPAIEKYYSFIDKESSKKNSK